VIFCYLHDMVLMMSNESETTSPALHRSTDEILALLKKVLEPQTETAGGEKRTVLGLLASYDTMDYYEAWKKDARLYCDFVHALVRTGHPSRGFKLALRGLEDHKDEIQLKYLITQSLARGGNIKLARKYLAQLLENDAKLTDHLKVEIYSLAGRIEKMEYLRTPLENLSPGQQNRAVIAKRSANWYEKAWKIEEKNAFPLINLATMSYLAGERDEAVKHAKQVLILLGDDDKTASSNKDYWYFATKGEAWLILENGNHRESANAYADAVQYAGKNVGDITSIRLNISLLAKHKQLDPDEVAKHLGIVVAFTGHMVDQPTWHLPPRFPNDQRLIKAVGDAIKAKLIEMNAKIGYSSLACGSDLLFAEAMIELGLEMHAILPFDEEDFIRTSVDFGLGEPMAFWKDKFHKVLEHLKPLGRVHFATKEFHLGDDSLFEFVNSNTMGAALMRSDDRAMVARVLAVKDLSSPRLIGGTNSFLSRWSERFAEPEIINLAEIRESTIPDVSTSAPAILKDTLQRRPIAMGRDVKAMLFADVKGFSGLTDGLIPGFFRSFISLVNDVILASTPGPLFKNTWGDGLYLVFDTVSQGADFAIRLIDAVERTDWESLHLPPDTTVRIGMHAGPVFKWFDPILERLNYSGSQVNRAARIEPVTIPGCVFVSEQFARLLTLENPDGFACDYVGLEDLAKKYDTAGLYRLRRNYEKSLRQNRKDAARKYRAASTPPWISGYGYVHELTAKELS
jgi:class 3 adenylate cyclase/tetratricopeptide (TPR) repeat protein